MKEDIFKMIGAFFCGAKLPKFITHTNLILLTKKLVVNIFSDVILISQSNFVNKIFSRIIHERIKGLLLEIISQEHVEFVQEKSIVENILPV